MKKILISGYYGYSNSGDDAILSSICNDIKQLSNDNEITILSNSPQNTTKEYGVHSIYRFSLKQVIKAIKATDIVLMGGGTLIQDNTSSRSLMYYLSIIWFAKKFNKKCIIYASGIGPIKRSINRKITKKVINTVDVITLREHLSKKELEGLGISEPRIYVTADPAFNLPTSKMNVDQILLDEGVDTSKPLVAVLFRSWKAEKDYIQKTATLCDHIINQYDMNIVFIPMKYPADLDISMQIQAAMTNKASVLKKKYDVSTLIELIGSMKLVLSMRLHALIYAAIKNVPMIGFVYDPKVDYYLKVLDMYSAGNISTYDINKVKKDINEIMDNYKAIQARLKDKALKLKKEASKNRELLDRL